MSFLHDTNNWYWFLSSQIVPGPYADAPEESGKVQVGGRSANCLPHLHDPCKGQVKLRPLGQIHKKA